MLRILLLEDDKSAVLLTSKILSLAEIAHQLTDVDNRDDFIKALEQKSFDLIISDYSLPSMNGFQAKELVDERHLHLPFILVTGVLSETEMLNVLKMGLTDMVLKSNLESLPAAVLKAVRESNERKLRLKENLMWQSVIEKINDCMFIIDKRGKIMYTNPAVERELGYANGMLNGEVIDRIVKWSATSQGRVTWNDLSSDKPCKAVVTHANGDVLWVEAQVHRNFSPRDDQSSLVNIRIVDEAVRSQTQLKWITDLIPGAVFRFVERKPGDFVIEYLSESVKNLTGFRAEEYGSNLQNIITKSVHPEDQRSFLEKVVWCVEHHAPFNHEFRSFKKDGSLIWGSAQAQPSYDAVTGNLVFNGLMTDITKQKEQELALAKVSQQYSTVVKATEVAFWHWNLEVDSLTVDSLVYSMLGYNKSIGEHFDTAFFYSKVHPDDLASIKAAFELYKTAQDDYVTVEYRLQHQEGHWLWFASRGAVVAWEGTRMKLLTGTIMDVTKEKVQSLKMAEQKQKLQAILAELEYQKTALDQHSIVSMATAGGKITYVNQQFSDLSGYTKEELIGSNHRLINSNLHSASFWKQLYDTIHKGEIWKGTIRNKAKTGSFFWCETTIVPFKDSDTGKVTKFVALRQDITKQKRVEEALVTTLDRLESVVQDRTQDLKNANRLLKLKNRDVTDSIEYARYIQDAFLTPLKASDLKVNDVFIWHFPKDILSGDFHWSYYNKEANVTYIALGDCTGHGVPGSLMTMLSVQLLERHSLIATKVKPNEVLQKVNQSMIQFLHQDEAQGVSDGMEVVLLCIDHANQKICFSTAGRPVYHWDQSTLHTYKLKGPKAVGGLVTGVTKTFPLHEFYYQPGDRVFAMSDGYADQFGGEDGKKMLRHRKEHMLRDIQQQPFKDHKKLIADYYNQWRGNQPQVDDVIVLGLLL